MLVFQTFYSAKLDKQYAHYGFIYTSINQCVNHYYKNILSGKKLDQSFESGMILSTAFMNTGNYGAPIFICVW